MIPLFKVAMSKKDMDEELLKVLHSGWIGQGSKVEEFESKLAKKFNNDNVVTLSSGTHGLTLALRLAGVGNGDSVICSSLSCGATCMPIVNLGAEIIWADTGKDINSTVKSIKESIKENTKAMIFVHWGGYPIDLEPIYKIAKENGIKLIEDAAHCYGSIYKDSIIGDCKYSDFCMISFQAIKFLTSVDGGVLFTKSKENYKKAKLMRWFGIDRENSLKDMRCVNDIKFAGEKFHMNDVNATIGISNMKLAEENVKISQDNAAYYDRELKNVNGIEITQNSSDRLSSYWLYTILVEDRTSFASMMGERGIHVSRVHERLDKYTFTKDFQKELPMLDSIYDKYIAIPVGWWVSQEDRSYIVNCIKQGW
jgi:dTDP-4-amino-4,6-dideoxygalactose transaminase